MKESGGRRKKEKEEKMNHQYQMGRIEIGTENGEDQDIRRTVGQTVQAVVLHQNGGRTTSQDIVLGQGTVNLIVQ